MFNIVILEYVCKTLSMSDVVHNVPTAIKTGWLQKPVNGMNYPLQKQVTEVRSIRETNALVFCIQTSNFIVKRNYYFIIA